ncbi:M15 family metallopeptidase [Robertkochia flava]|uniref:M15 family metallopeptidase n=1 Tax=Robertkochia flava TaxID=3447986 RepID=UPI001CCEAF2F|nr:M15 family metallopeptidase [Robertkochia marina]
MKKLICTFLIVVAGFGVLHAQEYPVEILTGKVDVTMEHDLSGVKPEVVSAFLKMQEAAAAEGIELKVVSGFRNYQRQLEIWNDKYKKYRKEGLTPPQAVEKIIEYSTIPGTSRHHWGTDLDIIDEAPDEREKVLDPEKFEEGGPFYKMKLWMDEHAESYGFYLVYTNAPGRKGFHYEPWHYSYAPISVPMLKAYLAQDINEIVQTADLLGGQLLSESFLEQYKREQISDINKDLID